MAADVDLASFDGNGEFLAVSENVGTEMESFTIDINAGDRYLGVISYDGVATNYDLGITSCNLASTFDMSVYSNNNIAEQ